MTDKQIIKPRPICLYQDTCLHLKEKTRLCEDCIHHKNYWSELLEKEQAEKIKSLEQECEKLKDKLNCCFCNPFVELNDIVKQQKCVEVTECFRRKLDQLKQTLTEIKEIAEWHITSIDSEDVQEDMKQILQKISECEAGTGTNRGEAH